VILALLDAAIKYIKERKRQAACIKLRDAKEKTKPGDPNCTDSNGSCPDIKDAMQTLDCP
jgi:hypothetical protein